LYGEHHFYYAIGRLHGSNSTITYHFGLISLGNIDDMAEGRHHVDVDAAVLFDELPVLAK